jgi:hypothetical protein
MQVARLHEKACKDIEALLQRLQREYNDTPELYPRMFNPIGVWTVLQQKLNKRKKDIVSRYALAAAYMNPYGLYVDLNPDYVDSVSREDDDNGRIALLATAQKYFVANVEMFAAATAIIRDFKRKEGWFGTGQPAIHSVNGGVDLMWRQAELFYSSEVTTFSRKLANSFAGHGAAERCNKLVKKIRNKLRNRQSHLTTSAWMTLDSHYQQQHYERSKQKNRTRSVKYIEAIKKTILSIKSMASELDDFDFNLVFEIDPAVVESDANDEDLDEYEEVDDIGTNVLVDMFTKETSADLNLTDEEMQYLMELEM